MLEHLRQRVIQTLATAHNVTLSTFGPAGLQSSRLPCEALETQLYLLIPRTSDLLFNIEDHPSVVVVNNEWNLSGQARVLSPGDYPPCLNLAHSPDVSWSRVVEIRPTRLNIHAPGQATSSETIDIE
jgi:hypothetical protein